MWVVIVLAVIVIVILGVFAFGNKAKAPEVPADTMAPTSTVASGTITATVGSSAGSASSSSPAVSITLSTSTHSYANGSFSFNYPLSWSIAQYSPFSMTNFNGQYGANGTIPPGGAVIEVVTTTVQSGFLPSIMDTQLMNAMDVTTTTLTVDDVACPAAAFEAAYAPGATSKNVSVYCLRGTELWEVYLSYSASDTAAASHVSDFNSVLGTMKFL